MVCNWRECIFSCVMVLLEAKRHTGRTGATEGSSWPLASICTIGRQRRAVFCRSSCRHTNSPGPTLGCSWDHTWCLPDEIFHSTESRSIFVPSCFCGSHYTLTDSLNPQLAAFKWFLVSSGLLFGIISNPVRTALVNAFLLCACHTLTQQFTYNKEIIIHFTICYPCQTAP